MESPIPILPLPTPDAETEKLIRMKDEEVNGATGEEQGLRWGGGGGPAPPFMILTPLSAIPASPPAKAHAGDAAEDEAANAGPVTPTQPHITMDIYTASSQAGPSHPWTPTGLDSTLE